MAALLIELPPVSIILPAYNEEAFVGTTVTSILESDFPCEVIVVDDGSTDRTLRILEGFGGQIRVIRHPVNRGKGAAMASGVRAATGDIVVFCDAHLLGLKQYHLLFLVLPLVRGSARVVLGVSTSEAGIFPQVLMPVLTGQRAYFRCDLEPLLDEMERLGYGVETFLFYRFPREQTVVVALPGLVHPGVSGRSIPNSVQPVETIAISISQCHVTDPRRRDVQSKSDTGQCRDPHAERGGLSAQSAGRAGCSDPPRR
jgi:glycosyltransferase involved in cell wall biosynthesis